MVELAHYKAVNLVRLAGCVVMTAERYALLCLKVSTQF